MLTETIARRYAKGFFAAVSSGKDTVKRELGVFLETLHLDPAFRELWYSRVFLPEAKKNFVKKGFPSFSETLLHFLFVLVDKRRESLISSCSKEYEKLLLDFYNQAFAVVRTPVPVSGPVQAELKRCLSEKEGKRIELVVSEEPDLLGGMVVEIGDKIFDGSLRTKLQDLREKLLALPLSA